MSTLTLSFLGRFCRAFRLVGSHLPGERENAAHAMYRLCAGEGVSITDLAIALENSDHEIAEKKYTDEDAVAIFVRGVEKGRAESRGRLLSASGESFGGASVARFSLRVILMKTASRAG